MIPVRDVIVSIGETMWHMLLQASPYMVLGILFAGLLKVFLRPETVARHLSRGRFKPVLKAALLGIPLPLCSCGVLPAAVTLEKEGANRGALTSFLISTPESGVDSMAVTWALMDPVITVARPIAAFVTAIAAGITVNFMGQSESRSDRGGTCGCRSACCGDSDSAHDIVPEDGFGAKVWAGMVYAARDVWADIAGWFFLGLLVAGIISALVSEDMMARYLGGGVLSMLVMLVAGIPMYICATASTPVAAALVFKGASPGTALVLMLAGPATNMTSLTVVYALLGRYAGSVYLMFIAIFSVVSGLLLDFFYVYFGISAQAVAGSAGEAVPYYVQITCAVLLLMLSLRPLLVSRPRRNVVILCRHFLCLQGTT